MEIPGKFIFKGALDDLQKVTKYFGNTLGIDIGICNTNGNSIVTAAYAVRKSVTTTDASAAMTRQL